MENTELKGKTPYEKLDEFLKTIEEKTTDEWCSNNHILDWLMQKSWSKQLTYTSYPDQEMHTVYDGLYQVFSFLDSLAYQFDENKAKYNQELLRCYKEIESLRKGVDSSSTQKLEQIKKILLESN